MHSDVPLPSPPDRPTARPVPHALAEVLTALDPLPSSATPPTGSALAELRPVVFQWLAVLDAANIGELAGVTDDLRELANALPLTGVAAPTAPVRAALHRAGLSLERVAAWGRTAGLTDDLLALGQRLLALAEELPLA